jgi:hypothetical protein
MRSVNEGIALFAVDAPTVAGETWAFACECGAAECDAWVDLELAEYAAIRADPDRAILSTGHVVSSPAQRARREAMERREEARALHEQAKQQLKRARRQLKPEGAARSERKARG